MSTEDFNTRVLNDTKYLQPFAMSLAKNQDDAKDLIQDTICRALVSRDKFSDDTNLKAWLYTIMKNIFINNYRRAKVIGTVLDISEYKAERAIGKTAANDGVSNMEMNYLNKELESLSNAFRVPFLLYYTGYKYEEIAKNLRLPVGTVKSRIFFARKEMQKKLSKGGYTGVN